MDIAGGTTGPHDRSATHRRRSDVRTLPEGSDTRLRRRADQPGATDSRSSRATLRRGRPDPSDQPDRHARRCRGRRRLALRRLRRRRAGDAERFCGEIAENKDELVARRSSSATTSSRCSICTATSATSPRCRSRRSGRTGRRVRDREHGRDRRPESQQAAAAAIYSSEESAAAIDNWLMANCAVDIGPVVTLVPHARRRCPHRPRSNTIAPRA